MATIAIERASDSISNITNESERNELAQQITVFRKKIEIEMTNSTRAGNINDAAYIGGNQKTEQAITSTVTNEA